MKTREEGSVLFTVCPQALEEFLAPSMCSVNIFLNEWFAVRHIQNIDSGGGIAKKIVSWQTCDVYFDSADKIEAGENFYAKIDFENEF